MASTLVVEDGSLVDGADSYISLADARTYATKRGISVAADDTAADIQLRKAFDYLEAIGADYKGTKSDPAQLTQWPRKDVWVDDAELSYAVIPTVLKYAQVQLAAAIQGGINLTPTSDGSAFIVREKIGPIDTEFSEAINTSGVPIVRIADSLLAPLLRRTGLLTVARA